MSNLDIQSAYEIITLVRMMNAPVCHLPKLPWGKLGIQHLSALLSR